MIHARRCFVAAVVLFSLSPVFASPMVYKKGVYEKQKKEIDKAIAEKDTRAVIKMLKKFIAPHKITAARYLADHGGRSAIKTLNEMNLRGGGWEGISHKKYPGFSRDASGEYAIAIYKISNREKSESEQIKALFEILDGQGPVIPKQVPQKYVKTNYAVGKRVAQELGKFKDKTILSRLRKSENRGVAKAAISMEIAGLTNARAMARCMQIARTDSLVQRNAAIFALGDFLPESIDLLDELALEGYKHALRMIVHDPTSRYVRDPSRISRKIFDILCWHLLKNDHAQIRIEALYALSGIRKQEFQQEIYQHLTYAMFDRSIPVRGKAVNALTSKTVLLKNKVYFDQIKDTLQAALINHPNPIVPGNLARVFKSLGYQMPELPAQPCKSKLLQDCLADEYQKYKKFLATIEDRKRKPPSEYLTIEQSLVPVFGEKMYTIDDFAFNRINPAIRKYLLSYLKTALSTDKRIDKRTDKQIGKAIDLLAYVGNSEDLKFVKNFVLQKEPGFATMVYLGKFTGVVIRRDIDGAEEFFRDMVEYIKLPGSEDTVSRRGSGSFLSNVCSYSLEDYTVKAFKMVADDKYGSKKSFPFSQTIDAETDAYSVNIGPSSIKRTALDRRITLGYWKHKKEIDALIAISDPEYYRQMPTHDKPAPVNIEAKPANKITLTGMTDDPLVQDALTQARAAYDKVSKLVLAGKFDGIDKLLADNGRAIPPGKMERMKSEFDKAMQQEKRLLEDVDKAGLNGRKDILVKVTVKDYQGNPGETTMQARFDSFLPKPQKVTAADKKKVTAATVTFAIPSTAKIYARHIPQAGGETETENGDLKVFMIKIDGKWLWNPFGW
ncbi:MAG: hypothetical protein FVQ82_12190 [Planctomycetes bacterium]|nr:hypothetical protein [Planctomycetota bacterium]